LTNSEFERAELPASWSVIVETTGSVRCVLQFLAWLHRPTLLSILVVHGE